MRKKYDSDISPEKFAVIEDELRGVRYRTKPTRVDLYESTRISKTLLSLMELNRPGFRGGMLV
ncbi:hypothetical protein E9531_15005 [Lampropedia puyangensis]|uniref:Uncharacterized protein n=1 Tax=Lampropedia puyangensis TaxID=1330072 RepID=A0A4S8EUD5_9BURK|nr:hypothetical protein E9531_15005 [Lampropedia puyangensis]